MELQGDRVYKWVETVANRAERFIVVSPFFTMDGRIRELLESIPSLQVVIGDEFSTNNPMPLKELSELESTDIRCIHQHDLGKRLHAKVFFAIEKSGRCQALVGSANFTVRGLTRNEEQAVSLDSDCDSDRSVLEQIERWVGELDKYASDIDWEWAKRQYEDGFDAYRRGQDRNYWVLKTTAGRKGSSRWEDFVRERVVSIGWEEVVEIVASEHAMGPNKYDMETLNAAASTAGYSRHAAKTIYWFSRKFSIGDRIILCRGYSPNQSADVHLYGLAIVDGEVFDDRTGDWWRLKRRAVLRCKDRDVPKDVFVNSLGKRSLLSTIHRISEGEYEEFCRQIQIV